MTWQDVCLLLVLILSAVSAISATVIIAAVLSMRGMESEAAVDALKEINEELRRVNAAE